MMLKKFYSEYTSTIIKTNLELGNIIQELKDILEQQFEIEVKVLRSTIPTHVFEPYSITEIMNFHNNQVKENIIITPTTLQCIYKGTL